MKRKVGYKRKGIFKDKVSSKFVTTLVLAIFFLQVHLAYAAFAHFAILNKLLSPIQTIKQFLDFRAEAKVVALRVSEVAEKNNQHQINEQPVLKERNNSQLKPKTFKQKTFPKRMQSKNIKVLQFNTDTYNHDWILPAIQDLRNEIRALKKRKITTVINKNYYNNPASSVSSIQYLPIDKLDNIQLINVYGTFNYLKGNNLETKVLLDSVSSPGSNGQILSSDNGRIKWIDFNPTNSINDLTDVDTYSSLPQAGDFLTWNGASWVPGRVASSTGIQTLTFNVASSTLSISEGNTVDLSALLDNTDNQILSLTGNILSISGGNSQDLSGLVVDWNNLSNIPAGFADNIDNDTTYTSGNGLTLSGTTFSINSPTCSGTDKLQWNGSAFVCSPDIDTDTTYTAGTGLSLSGTTFSLNAGIDLMTDVDTTTNAPTNGQVLAWDGANWVPSNPQGMTPGTQINNTLRWDGSTWAESNALQNDGINISTTGTLTVGAYTLPNTDGSSGQVLKTDGAGNLTWQTDNDTTYSAGAGITLTGTTFSLTNDFGASIDSNEITDGTITNVDIANTAAIAYSKLNLINSIVSGDISDGSVQETDLANNINISKFVNDTGYLTSADLADNDPANELNTSLTLSGTNLSITDAGGTLTQDLVSIVDWNNLSNIPAGFADNIDNDTTYTSGNGLTLSGTTFSINSPTCSGTDKLQWNGSAFVCSPDIDTDTTYTAGTGLSLSGTTFSLNAGIDLMTDVDTTTNAPTNGQVLTWDGANWVPAADKNIYDNDGTLSATRTITMAGNDLILNGGNVGIGVSAPQRYLHVAASAPVTTTFSDSFEDGTIDPFVSSGNALWVTDNTTASQGTISAKAGTITDNQNSYLDYTVRIAAGGGTVTFDYSVSSEANYDFLRFYIDGTEQQNWSGNVAWSSASFNLSAGTHTLRWAYTKDVSVSVGSDTAWIDNVQITNVSVSDGESAVFDGKVGIGTVNPTQMLQVGESGDGTSAVANAWNTFSDRRWKTNIKDLQNSLDIIKRLRPVRYDWKSTGKSSIGFIAQDVKEVLPSIVTEDKKGYLSLDYSKFTPVLVAAVQEQQKELDLIKASLGEEKSASFAETIIKSLKEFGMELKGAYLSFNKIFVDNLEIGNKKQAGGITMYDEVTGEAYCVKIVNGQIQTLLGDCVTLTKKISHESNKNKEKIDPYTNQMHILDLSNKDNIESSDPKAQEDEGLSADNNNEELDADNNAGNNNIDDNNLDINNGSIEIPDAVNSEENNSEEIAEPTVESVAESNENALSSETDSANSFTLEEDSESLTKEDNTADDTLENVQEITETDSEVGDISTITNDENRVDLESGPQNEIGVDEESQIQEVDSVNNEETGVQESDVKSAQEQNADKPDTEQVIDTTPDITQENSSKVEDSGIGDGGDRINETEIAQGE